MSYYIWLIHVGSARDEILDDMEVPFPSGYDQRCIAILPIQPAAMIIEFLHNSNHLVYLILVVHVCPGDAQQFNYLLKIILDRFQ